MSLLETDRLELREFVPEDVHSLAAVLCDPETMCYYPAPFDRAAVAHWIDRNLQRYSKDGHGLWAMILKSSGELVGDCGLTRQVVDEGDEIEIGYHVRRNLWGKGYASEAARACRDYGFATLNVGRLISMVRPENLASRRVAEKTGMTVWKELKWAGFLHYFYAMTWDQAL
jgi:RimJ/RimL family protein N-acetyltransferase